MATLADRIKPLKGRRIYLFGAGDCGVHARHMLEKRFGVTVCGFIDSFRSGTLDGLPIVRADTFHAEHAQNSAVLITSQYWREIRDGLRARGHDRYDLLVHAPVSWRNLNHFQSKLVSVDAAAANGVPPGRLSPAASPQADGAPHVQDTDVQDTGSLTADAPAHLLTVPFNSDCSVDLPLTERCNLRCGYCPHHDTSRKDWSETAPWLVDRVHAFLTPHPGVRIELGGGAGETTVLKDWQRQAERFMAIGSRLRMTTNLARELRWDEAETLSRFFHISVSFDSVDSRILKSVRVGANPAKIVFNIAQIRAAAMAVGREPPSFNIQAVVTDKSVALVDQVAAMAAALGIKYVRYIALNGGTYDAALSGIAGLARDQARKAVASFERAFEIGIDADLTIEVDDEVSDCLAACLSRPATLEDAAAPAVPVAIPAAIPAAIPVAEPGLVAGAPAEGCPPGKTRLCLEPWTHVIFTYDGTVFSCCYGAPTFRPDYAAIGTDMNAIFNDEPIRDLRRRLLTGDLSALCHNCVQKPMVAVSDLREKVDALIRVRRQPCNVESPNG